MHTGVFESLSYASPEKKLWGIYVRYPIRALSVIPFKKLSEHTHRQPCRAPPDAVRHQTTQPPNVHHQHYYTIFSPFTYAIIGLLQRKPVHDDNQTRSNTIENIERVHTRSGARRRHSVPRGARADQPTP